MGYRPGQLLLAKTDFEATQIPLDYSDELKLTFDKRKTLHRIRITKNQFLFIVSIPKNTYHFFPGSATTLIARKIIFLLGDKLCMSTILNNWDDYVGLINYDYTHKPRRDGLHQTKLQTRNTSQGQKAPRY